MLYELDKKLGIIVLIFLVLIVFGGTFQHDYINYDDNFYVYENEHITTGISSENLKWAFTETGETNLWHPLTWISHMIDVELFGVEGVGGHHTVNVFWHIIATVGLYLILSRLVGNHWIALVVTAIWAIHTQRVQSVAWISERKDVLSGAFFCWSWLVWEIGRASRDKSRFYYCISLTLFVAASLAKPSVVPLPLIFLVSEIFKSDGLKFTKLMSWSFRLTPFFIVSVAVAALTIHFQQTGGMSDLTSTMPISRRLMLMPLSLWWYIQHFCWPGDCKLWVYPPVRLISEWLVPIIGLSFLTCILVFLARRNKLVKLGVTIYFILWLPVSGLVPVSFYYVADRYSYLPQIGLIIILAGLFLCLLEFASKLRRTQVIAVSSIIIVILSFLSWKKTSYWKNSESLFLHEREINKRSLLAPIQLGAVRDKEGRNEEALTFYSEAAAIDRESALAYTGIGQSLMKMGNEGEAEKALTQAIQCKTQRIETPYSMLAKIMVERGAIESAEEILVRGLDRFPKSIMLMLDLGALAQSYRHDAHDAIGWYQKILEINPKNPDALQGKGVSLIEQGKVEEGNQILRKLFLLHPERADIKSYLENNP